MNDQTIRFRLGIFVLASLILLAVLIVLFGGVPTVFQPSERYFLTFEDATNVGPGTPVRRSGVKIGEVEAVTLDDETGSVTVAVRVSRPYTVRKGDEPVLKQGLLGSDSYIDFVAQDVDGQPPDRAPVEPGSKVKGVVVTDARTALQRATELVPPTEQTLNDIRRTLNRFEKVAPVLEATLQEYRRLAEEGRAAMPDIRKAAAEMAAVTAEARQRLPQLERTLDEIQVGARNWKAAGERFNVLLQANEKKVGEALTQLEETARRISEIFNKENQDYIQSILRNTKVASDRLDAIAKDFNDLVKNANEAAAEVEKTVARVGAVFDEENQQAIDAILRNLKTGTDRLDSISGNADVFLRDIRNSLAKIDRSIDGFDPVLANLKVITDPLAASSPALVRNLDSAVMNLNEALGDVRHVIRAITQKDGTVQKLLYDPGLYNKLDEAACGITRLVPRLDHILRDVEIFADRIARHPEALGVGGAVRPSTGLKELPPYPVFQPGH